MRVYAGCRKQNARFRFGKCGGFYIAIVATARHDYPADLRISRPLQNLVPIIIETVVRKICADINQ